MSGWIRGYPDWARQEDWDGPALWSLVSGTFTTAKQSPIMDVRSWASLVGIIEVISGPVTVDIAWYADAAGQIQLVSREFYLSPLIARQAQFCFRNMGPYCQVSINGLAVSSFDVTAVLIGSNRQSPIEFLPTFPVILSQQSITLGSGVNGTYYPTDYYAGPVHWWLDASNTSWTLIFQALNSAGDWDDILEVVPTTGNINGTAIMPPGAWRCFLSNGGAGITFWLAVTPSTSGST